MLKVENLHVSVENKEILRGIDLEVNPGEFHVIMGAKRLRKVNACTDRCRSSKVQGYRWKDHL